MKKVQVKLGMWRTRDGKIACVYGGRPWFSGYPWEVQYAGGDCSRATNEGHYFGPADLRDQDLVEFLSDEIADPDTWHPPVELCEGVWEREDGSRVLVRDIKDGNWQAIDHATGSYLYTSDGLPSYTQPRITKFIGPSPLRGPKEINHEKIFVA
jgi:hypothetical protein